MSDEQMDATLRAAGERWRERTDGDTLTTEADDEVLGHPVPRRRRTWFVAVAAAAVVALIAGLTFALRGDPRHAPVNAESAGLEDVVWLLQGTQGARSTATFYIDRKGDLVADDECRLIGGHARVSGNRLSVTGLSVRYKGCTDQYGAGFYDRGTTVLRGPATFTIDSIGLTITRKHVGALRFVPAPSAVPAPSLDVPTLTDTTWRAPDGKTLRIDAATGEIGGTLCSSHATVSGPTVTFKDCRPPIGQGTYLAAISGATLTLTAQSSDPGFSGMSSELTFVWQPADASVDPASLTGRAWDLRAVAGQPTSAGSLSIDSGVAQIDFGCGSFRVSARVEQGTFTVDHFAPPLNSCAANAATAASMLSQQPVAWVVRGGKLIVYGGGSQTFSLVYAAEPQSSALQGDWTLANVFNGSGAPSPRYATATLTIAANGTVTGTDGCRTFTGTVSTSGSTATFSLTMPEPACSPNVEQTAGFVDRVLSAPVSFTVGSGVLVLSNNEIGRLSFADRPTSGQSPTLLTEHSWQIDTITYGTGHFRNGAPSQDNGLLSFTDHSYEVQHRCSMVHGVAHFTPGSMSLSKQAYDAHSCPPPAPGENYTGESEQAIDKILSGTVRWSIDGSVLTLTSGQGSLRAIGGIPADLTSATWRLTGIAQGATETTAVGSVVLTFPKGTQIQLVRCYTSAGRLYLGDSSFSVANFRTTVALPCPSGPPGTQQQNGFLDQLLSGGEVTWSVVGDTLTLNRDGAGQAIFVRTH